MEIFGAGFGRTGTLSLKVALEQLGFGPCHHMEAVAQSRSQSQAWQAIHDGELVAWNDVYAGFNSAVDAPTCLYYKSLLDAYPNAKFVLTVREPERWYESVRESIYQLSLTPPWMLRIPVVGDFMRYTRATIWNGFFEGRFEDRDYAIGRFNQHNAEVQQTIPADRLLVFSVKEGWEPLCNFLDVPIPDTPFPHVNDRATMQKRLRQVKRVRQFAPLIGIGLLGLIGWRLMRLLK